jgi:hypothetical protein
MLSYLRVSFETTDGLMEVLIEGMQEMNADGPSFCIHWAYRFWCFYRCPGEGRLRMLNKERQARNRWRSVTPSAPDLVLLQAL